LGNNKSQKYLDLNKLNEEPITVFVRSYEGTIWVVNVDGNRGLENLKRNIRAFVSPRFTSKKMKLVHIKSKAGEDEDVEYKYSSGHDGVKIKQMGSLLDQGVGHKSVIDIFI